MLIRSLLFNIAFWTMTFTLGLAGLPFALVSPRAAHIVARMWGKCGLFLARALCGITYQVKGAEYIPRTPSIVASKHQSAWDTIIFWVLLNRPGYVLKRELLFFPVFGWHLMLLKNIYIDRKGGSKVMKRMLKEAKELAEDGRSIVIFPEGTRTAPYASSIYHPGVAALYSNSGLPVVPVALNSGLLWPKNAFRKTPGVITIEFLPPIPPGMKGRDFLKLLQEQIETACGILPHT